MRSLAQRLQSAGREPWVDWEDIPPSAKWMATIRAAIEGATAVVFVISPPSLASAVCRDELAHALASHKRIIPVLAQPAGALPPELAELNWVDFAQAQDDAAAFASLVAAIDRDPQWVQEHTRLLVRAREWEGARHDSAYLLRGKDLEVAQQWLATATQHPEPRPTDLHIHYIQTSRAAQARGQRLRAAAAAAAVVVSASLAAWAWVERANARTNEAQAVAQRDLAESRRVATLDALQWVFNRTVQVPIDRMQLDADQQGLVTGLLQRIRSAGFDGRILVGGHLGTPFVLRRGRDVVVDPCLPWEPPRRRDDMDMLNASREYALGAAYRQAEVLRKQVLSELRISDANVDVFSYGVERPHAQYPKLPAGMVTARQCAAWNKAALRNNRLEIHFRPTEPAQQRARSPQAPNR